MESTKKSAPPLLVLTSVAKKSDAARIARTLVVERLAACVTVLPAAESHYVWKKKLCREKEFVLLIKTLHHAYRKLRSRLLAIHPYECPEILGLPISVGFSGYLRWLRGGVD